MTTGEKTMQPILIYYIIINIITYILFGIDKLRAKAHRWRIPEATLLFLCVIGGAFGGFAGMFSFHHKIRKNKFRYPIPLLMIIQLILIYRYIH